MTAALIRKAESTKGETVVPKVFHIGTTHRRYTGLIVGTTLEVPRCMNEDMHIHSTFSDGKHSVEINARVAHARGLVRIAAVDHVRCDTTWLPHFVQEVARVEKLSGLQIESGAEAKLVDALGNLDVPSNIDLVDRVYAADHQVPLGDSYHQPRKVRDLLARSQISVEVVLNDLISAYIGVVTKYDRVTIAHPFSVLPKIGLLETQLCDKALDHLVEACIDNGADIEIGERWRCPNAKIVRKFLDGGVRVRLSTDSHRAESIGHYDYSTTTLAEAKSL